MNRSGRGDESFAKTVVLRTRRLVHYPKSELRRNTSACCTDMWWSWRSDCRAKPTKRRQIQTKRALIAHPIDGPDGNRRNPVSTGSSRAYNWNRVLLNDRNGWHVIGRHSPNGYRRHGHDWYLRRVVGRISHLRRDGWCVIDVVVVNGSSNDDGRRLNINRERRLRLA